MTSSSCVTENCGPDSPSAHSSPIKMAPPTLTASGNSTSSRKLLFNEHALSLHADPPIQNSLAAKARPMARQWRRHKFVGAGGVRYNVKLPTSPLAQTSIQPYADAVCAWMAGAYTGDFTGYLFIDLKTKEGPMAGGTYVFQEDMYPGSKTLPSAIAYAFRGVDDLYRTKAMVKDLKPNAELGKDSLDRRSHSRRPPTKNKDRFVLQVESEMKRMETMFLLDTKRLRDCARLLTDLPFPEHARNVLLIGDITASKGALRLPNDFDFLDSIGHVAGQELGSYRMIAIADSDQALIRDDVVSGITDWLKSQPGLLYIHGSLSTSGTNGLPTCTDLTGRLKLAWPWAADVAFAEKQYHITGTKAVAIASDAGPQKLVSGAAMDSAAACCSMAPASLRPTCAICSTDFLPRNK